MPLELGATFAHYRIDGLLGRGGMSDVYRAFDDKEQRQVALKVLRRDNELAKDHDQRFLREARVASKVRHPNAVTVFDYGEAEGIPYIAMEVVEGHPLTEYLEPGKSTLEQKLRWLVDLANALQAAHDARLVHRDVKPENVMVCTDGSVKLLDFGVAKSAKLPGVEISTAGIGPTSFRTAAGVIVGTPLYMSPEQLLEDPLDGRSDQYCWGLLAYELLSGGTARDPNFHPLKYLSEDPKPLDELVPDLPEYVCRTVMRALSRNREARFGSMTEAAHALVGAPPPTNLPPPPRPSSWKIESRLTSRPNAKWRRWVPIVLPAAVVFSVVMGVGLLVIHCRNSAIEATEQASAAPSASSSALPAAVASGTDSSEAPSASNAPPAPSASASATASASAAAEASSVVISHVASTDPHLPSPAIASLLDGRGSALAACVSPKTAPLRCTLQIRADGGIAKTDCGHGNKQTRCVASALQGVSFGNRKSSSLAQVSFQAVPRPR